MLAWDRETYSGKPTMKMMHRITDRTLEQTEERVENMLEAACREPRYQLIRLPRVSADGNAEFELRFSRVPVFGIAADVRQAIADALRELADRVLGATR